MVSTIWFPSIVFCQENYFWVVLAWGKVRGRGQCVRNVRTAPQKEGDGGTCSSVSPHLLLTASPTNAGWGNIPYSFSCYFCHSLLTPPGWVRLELSQTWVVGWGQVHRAAYGRAAEFSSCWACPYSLPFSLFISVIYCHTVLALLFCPSIFLILQCWQMCWWSTDDFLCTAWLIPLTFCSSPHTLPYFESATLVKIWIKSVTLYDQW